MRLREFSGWRGSILLLTIYIVAEMGTGLLGGDWGAFLYVTFHFIVTPLISAGVILLTVARVLQERGTTWTKLVVLSAIVVPLAIIWLAISGEPGLARLLPDF